ncbi:MAG: hypothetical protein HKUEN07_36710 [Rhodocyclaceae bacterium]|nr:MAG: hypothetical protein HKUEN07_36710 [Rhodocyclaceae bacterium]
MDEPYPLPLSALQHWADCPRECDLIHLEQAFDDKVHTLRGQAAHRQVDAPGMALRHGVRIERTLPPPIPDAPPLDFTRRRRRLHVTQSHGMRLPARWRSSTAGLRQGQLLDSRKFAPLALTPSPCRHRRSFSFASPGLHCSLATRLHGRSSSPTRR